MENTQELKAGFEFESQWEANYDNARDFCMSDADNILMEVEHIVHNLDQTLDVNNVLIVANAINKIREMCNYRYVDPFNDEPYDYVFTKQVTRILQDRLSFELGEE